MGLDPIALQISSRRVSVLVKLANSPISSWHHVALLYHHLSESQWLSAALADVPIVLPFARLLAGVSQSGIFLHSPGEWSDGHWHCILPWSLQSDLLS